MEPNSYVAANPGVPEAVIKATSEAVKLFYTDKALAIDAFRTFDPQVAPADLARLYNHDVKSQILDRVPIVHTASIKASAARLADEIPATRSFDFRAVTDNSTVVRLSKAGWFEKLFGPAIKAEQDAKLKAAM